MSHEYLSAVLIGVGWFCHVIVRDWSWAPGPR
jgi:hypothetical protein